jgi:hypothetical protein
MQMSHNLTNVKGAKELVGRIQEAALDDDFKALLTIDADPSSKALLDRLPAEQTVQARVHLRNARIWKGRQNEKAKSKLDAAESAIDGLDLQLARGILRKLDPGVLADIELERYDGLLLEVEARAMEIEDIESHITPPPPDKGQRRKPFWRS